MAVSNPKLGNNFYKEHGQPPLYKQMTDYRDYRCEKHSEFENNDCRYTKKSKRIKAKAKKVRLNQYILFRIEEENRKEKEYASRRLKKKLNRKLRRKKPRFFRFLRFLTAIVWLVGISITFCSTIRGLGEGTVFWKEHQTFRVIGPVTIIVGVALLLTTEVIRDIINRRQSQKRDQSMHPRSVSKLYIMPSSSKSSSRYQRDKCCLPYLQHPKHQLNSILRGAEASTSMQLEATSTEKRVHVKTEYRPITGEETLYKTQNKNRHQGQVLNGLDMKTTSTSNT